MFQAHWHVTTSLQRSRCSRIYVFLHAMVSELPSDRGAHFSSLPHFLSSLGIPHLQLISNHCVWGNLELAFWVIMLPFVYAFRFMFWVLGIILKVVIQAGKMLHSVSAKSSQQIPRVLALLLLFLLLFSVFAMQALDHLSHSTHPFLNCCLEIGSHFMSRLAWNCDPPICASPRSWNERPAPLSLLLLEIGSLELFIRAGLKPQSWYISQMARITGSSHHQFSFLFYFLFLRQTWDPSALASQMLGFMSMYQHT
jgi:hypothetical protein